MGQNRFRKRHFDPHPMRISRFAHARAPTQLHALPPPQTHTNLFPIPSLGIHRFLHTPVGSLQPRGWLFLKGRTVDTAQRYSLRKSKYNYGPIYFIVLLTVVGKWRFVSVFWLLSFGRYPFRESGSGVCSRFANFELAQEWDSRRWRGPDAKGGRVCLQAGTQS